MPFDAGISGNAKGRPKARHTAAVFKTLIGDDLELLVAALINSAKMGDVGALKIIFDRLYSPLKSQSLPLPVKIPATGSLVDRGEAVIRSMLLGRISVDAGAKIISALAAQSKVVELIEVSERLERIEKLLLETKGER
jgi:hypothetical protein